MSSFLSIFFCSKNPYAKQSTEKLDAKNSINYVVENNNYKKMCFAKYLRLSRKVLFRCYMVQYGVTHVVHFTKAIWISTARCSMAGMSNSKPCAGHISEKLSEGHSFEKCSTFFIALIVQMPFCIKICAKIGQFKRLTKIDVGRIGQAIGRQIWHACSRYGNGMRGMDPIIFDCFSNFQNIWLQFELISRNMI